ncbi:hypothetical protein ACP70R_036996 [Stipagrostis hirtigluma subsp. patula]
MGNTVPPRVCREAAGTAAAGAGKKRSENAVVEAAPARTRRVAVMARRSRQRDEEEAQRAGGHAHPALGTVVTVKIVMKRKDADALVARLNEQGARERKARMRELKSELRRGDEDGGGASPASSCRDAWRPRLAAIQEK